MSRGYETTSMNELKSLKTLTDPRTAECGERPDTTSTYILLCDQNKIDPS